MGAGPSRKRRQKMNKKALEMLKIDFNDEDAESSAQSGSMALLDRKSESDRHESSDTGGAGGKEDMTRQASTDSSECLALALYA